MRRSALSPIAAPLVALTLTGCPSSTPGDSAGSSSSASATSSASAATSAGSAASSASVAPKPYQGPTGTVRGVVSVTGDAPPLTAFKYPKGCEAASGVYGKLFRVGQDGQLADAVITVTHYDGFVPPKQELVKLTIKECAYSQRSVVLTNGQRLEVTNLDPMTSYIPHLDGARLPATIVAVPRGPSVPIPSRGLGRYWLRDQMGREFMVAHVFHLPYSTAAVTGLDGRYAIEGIPVGKAKLHVMLPQTKTLKTVSKDIEVKKGDNVFDLSLPFDAEADTPADGHGGTKPKKAFAEPK